MVIQPIPRGYREFREDYSCLGKARWRTEKSAQRALAAMRADGRGEWDSTVRPYRCGRCRRFHLGHGR